MGLFNSKNDESINSIRKLTEKDFISETEFLDKFTYFLEEFLIIHNSYDIFSNYLKKVQEIIELKFTY